MQIAYIFNDGWTERCNGKELCDKFWFIVFFRKLCRGRICYRLFLLLDMVRLGITITSYLFRPGFIVILCFQPPYDLILSYQLFNLILLLMVPNVFWRTVNGRSASLIGAIDIRGRWFTERVEASRMLCTWPAMYHCIQAITGFYFINCKISGWRWQVLIFYGMFVCWKGGHSSYS